MSKKQHNRRAKAAAVAKTETQTETRNDAAADVGQQPPAGQASAEHAVAHETRQALSHEADSEANDDARHDTERGARHETAHRAKHEARAQPRQPARSEAPPIVQADVRADVQADIRGVLIQLAGARLLLPNATIAEVLSYAPPEPVDAAPDWLLGKIRWRGWQLPLVAFAELAGVGKEPAGLGSKVVVLKALGGNAKAPYFAILSQGFPRLVTVAKDGLVPDADSAELPLGVHSRVIMNEDTAFVPDLGVVESLITDALAEAA